MENKLNAKAFGYSLAIISALCMLLLGIAGNIGVYTGAVEMMQEAHLFFSLDILGIITGMIEGAIWGFIAGWFIVVFYNKFVNINSHINKK